MSHSVLPRKLVHKLHKDNIVEQEEASWCGVACVKMILDCYGIIYSQKKIARILRTTNKWGTDSSNIKKFLHSLGIKAWEISGIEYDTLLRFFKNNDEPFLVHWWDGRRPPPDGHYSLILSMNKDWITLADPATGIPFEFSKKAFLEIWKDGENDKPSHWVMIC